VHINLALVIIADVDVQEPRRWRGEALGQHEVADCCASGYCLREGFP
jgi:hypothetical protein